MEAQAPDANKASMTLVGLRSRGDGEGPAGGAAEGWLPQEGEEVSVLKMGGATGRVGLLVMCCAEHLPLDCAQKHLRGLADVLCQTKHVMLHCGLCCMGAFGGPVGRGCTVT